MEKTTMLRRLLKNKKGQGLVEYALIIAGVTLMAAAAVAVFGHKVTDLMAASAAVLPGAHADDNAPIVSAKIIETTPTGGPAGDAIAIDVDTIAANSNTARLGVNVGLATPDNFGGLVVEAQ
jgi:Flp pilus assembly pilin Flp